MNSTVTYMISYAQKTGSLTVVHLTIETNGRIEDADDFRKVWENIAKELKVPKDDIVILNIVRLGA